eukprot:867800-Rhodomonas_salina.2
MTTHQGFFGVTIYFCDKTRVSWSQRQVGQHRMSHSNCSAREGGCYLPVSAPIFCIQLVPVLLFHKPDTANTTFQIRTGHDGAGAQGEGNQNLSCTICSFAKPSFLYRNEDTSSRCWQPRSRGQRWARGKTICRHHMYTCTRSGSKACAASKGGNSPLIPTIGSIRGSRVACHDAPRAISPAAPQTHMSRKRVTAMSMVSRLLSFAAHQSEFKLQDPFGACAKVKQRE